MDKTKEGINTLMRAIGMISDGKVDRVDLGHGTKAYKVPSHNPNKFLVRVDIDVYMDHV